MNCQISGAGAQTCACVILRCIVLERMYSMGPITQFMLLTLEVFLSTWCAYGFVCEVFVGQLEFYGGK